MALSTARIHRVRGRPPLLAAGIKSLIHSHSSSVRSLGYIFLFIYSFYTNHEDFSDRLLDERKTRCRILICQTLTTMSTYASSFSRHTRPVVSALMPGARQWSVGSSIAYPSTRSTRWPHGGETGT